MSIRAEDAAAEASRFSLRTSLFGSGAPDAVPSHAVPASAPPAPPPRSPPPTAAPRAPPTLSFNSVVGNAGPNARAAAPPSNQKNTQATLQAIARIAEEHRMRAAAGRPAPVAGPGADATRTLPSGYIHGGNQRKDAQAEVMRLTATVDALNGKLASQSERLQRTEASLVRANRAMTSERATSNARLLRMQNEVKELRARESSVRESALAQARREVQKTDAAFGESAKRAEAYVSKLSELEERIATLSGEKTALAARVAELTTSLEQSTLRVDAAETKLSASTADAPGNVEEMARLSQSVETAVAAKDELAGRLAQTEAKHEAVLGELEVARAEVERARAAGLESHSAHEDVRKRLQTEVEELMAQNQTLQARLDEIVAFPIVSEPTDADASPDASADEGCVCDASREDLETQLAAVDAQIAATLAELDTCSSAEASKFYRQTGKLTKQRHTLQTTLDARTPDPETPATDAAVAESLRAELDASRAELCVVGAAVGCQPLDPSESRQSTIERWMELLQVEEDETETATSEVFFETPPAPRAGGGALQHPTACRLGAAMARHGHGKRLPTCRVNPMASYRVTRARFDTAITGDAAIPPDVAALIEAVSKDISDACLRQRRAYLAATGKSEAEIEEELSTFA